MLEHKVHYNEKVTILDRVEPRDLGLRGESLRSEVEASSPEFAREASQCATLHLFQDELAPDFSAADLLLLGKMVKYAGIKGRSLVIVCGRRPVAVR